MAIKRIIPISSGKGGVGKTTFAVNFSLSLSRHGRTVLVDLDTGTSAIRNAIDVPVRKDLYHFFRKGDSLSDCITKLDRRLDPQGLYPNFGFVAGPRHMIEEITNFRADRKAILIDAINNIDADYVILDMKAGLDSNVIDFLPFSNSGILVFTPNLPSATLAASDIVKAILFRKLRSIFTRSSPLFAPVAGGKRKVSWKAINELLDIAEDVYDPTIGNLDDFSVAVHERLGEHPVSAAIENAIQYFKVHYVLNLFDGVSESFNTAVKPFIANLTENVSGRCTVTNLGWIRRSEAIHDANCSAIPALLQGTAKEKKLTRYDQALEDIRVTTIGLDRTKKGTLSAAAVKKPEDHLGQQLDALKTMFRYKKDDDFRANFEYMTQRALFMLKNRRPSDLGDIQVFTADQMMKLIFAMPAGPAPKERNFPAL